MCTSTSKIHIGLILLLVTGFSYTGLAQDYFGLLIDPGHVASFGVQAHPGLQANANYLYSLTTEDAILERYGFLAQVNMPLFSQPGLDIDVRLGGGGLLSISPNFKTIAGISWHISRTEDLNGRYVHSGFTLDLMPGYYGSKWVVAPHIGLRYQPWVHITHSAYARQAFSDLYAEELAHFSAPKNGWFYQRHVTLQTGLALAYYQPTWQVNVIAGFQYQPNQLGLIALPDIGMIPFYGGVNVGYSLSQKTLEK